MRNLDIPTHDMFQTMIDNKDFKISELIVNGILDNIKTNKNIIDIGSITINEEIDMLGNKLEPTIYDISLEKKNFSITLKENLGSFLEKEKYEECNIINNAINLLENEQK